MTKKAVERAIRGFDGLVGQAKDDHPEGAGGGPVIAKAKVKILGDDDPTLLHRQFDHPVIINPTETQRLEIDSVKAEDPPKVGGRFRREVGVEKKRRQAASPTGAESPATSAAA